MNASPQPTVVPATGTGVTGTNRSRAAAPAVERRARPRDPNVTTTSRPRSWATPRMPATVGSSSAPGQPTNPMSTCAHRSREPLDRVVAEAEEVGRDLEAGAARPAAPSRSQLADRALDQDDVQPAARRR